MRTSSPRRKSSRSSSPERIPSYLWLVAPIGLFLCLANVIIIVGQVETHSDQQQLDETVISPDSAVHRIASGGKKVPPPIIRGVQMQQTNDTASVVIVDDDKKDDVDQGYDESEEEKSEEEEEEEEEESEEESDGDDYWLGDDDSIKEESKSLDEPEDKSPILQILREAGIDDIDNETLAILPTWKEVTRLYGLKPRIYGLETCKAFQQHSDPAEHFLGVAGCFNSGTNLLSELLIHNCLMTKRMEKYGAQNKGIRWQVPWGKHSPPLDEEFRKNHKTKPGDKNIEAHNVFAAVTIRDPYVWMRSMCRHQYGAYWPNDTGHCPNLSSQ